MFIGVRVEQCERVLFICVFGDEIPLTEIQKCVFSGKANDKKKEKKIQIKSEC